ncbi:Omega-amidase YafV [Lysinibacillus sphaericus]
MSLNVKNGRAQAIRYDIRFPEWLRAHALTGAKVLFVPAQWPTPRIDHWKTLLQARAIENQCFVIAVNRIANKVENFNGQSMVIQPWEKCYGLEQTMKK